MNKKIFIKNRPFDINDANDMQNWTEDALKKTMASIYSNGVVQGLNVVQKTGLQVTLNTGTAFDANYDFINVSSPQTITLDTANTSPRIDKIVIKYLSSIVDNVDTTNVYGLGTSLIFSQNKLDSFVIQVVKGTPAASPVSPSTPAGTIALAQILVPANALSVNTSNITDLRAFITINSNIIKPEVIFSNAAPTDTTVIWIDTNENKPKVYKNNAWVVLNANDADTLDGKHASDFATSNHTHTDIYKKDETFSQTEINSNFLKKSDNLASLENKVTARANLGLGTMATQSTSGYSAANHNHNGTYVIGDYILLVDTVEPSSPTLKHIWLDTYWNYFKRYNGTFWTIIGAGDAKTLNGLISGNEANNVLKLDNNGKVPITNLPDNLWNRIILENNWTEYTTCQYKKNMLNEIAFRGVMKTGKQDANTVLFTLPVGSRPPENFFFNTYSDSGLANDAIMVMLRIDASNGQCSIHASSPKPKGFIALNNIKFSLDSI